MSTKTKEATSKSLSEVSDEVVSASIKIVNTAKDEAGKWISDIEERVGELPKVLDEKMTEGKERVLAETEAWTEKTRTVWSDLLEQLKGAGSLLQSGVEPLIHRVGLASQNDVTRLEKKLKRLAAQVRKLEKGR